MTLPAYSADADDTTKPTDNVSGGYAAREIRALKTKVNTQGASITATAGLVTTEAAARVAADNALATGITNEGITRLAADDALAAQIAALSPKSCFAYLNNPIYVTAGAPASPATVSWEAAVGVTSSIWVIGDPTKFTVPAGYTKAKVHVQLLTEVSVVSGVVNFLCEVTKNGSVAWYPGKPAGGHGLDTYAAHLVRYINMESPWIPVVAGDFFQVYLRDLDTDYTILGNVGGNGSFMAIELYP